MLGGLPQERIKRIQNGMAVWQAVHKPLVETVNLLYVLVRNVVDAGADGSEEADPHPGSVVGDVGISITLGYANNHVRADGIVSVHWKAAVDGLLAAFSVPRFVELDGCILQAATLKKCGDGFANGC
jgi:hypothetical protein